MTQNPNSSTQIHQVKNSLDSTPIIKENHLSSSAELILKYEERNFEIEDATKSTILSKDVIQSLMKEPVEPSKLKGEQLLKKYGTMIENQPMFLRELIYKNYVPYLPEKFKLQFSELMLLGGGFEAVWWGSLVFTLFRAYKYRNVDLKLKQKASKGIGVALIFVLSSLGFHNQIYIPKMKTCFYRNIKSIDSLMDRHIKILQSCGTPVEQLSGSIQISKSHQQNINKIVPSSQVNKKEQANKK